MILNAEHLSICLPIGNKNVPIIRDISFQVHAGEILGVVGESGCGKSVTNLALMGLLPPRTLIQAKKLELLGKDLLTLSKRQWRSIRGSEIAMIFQNPMSALNPSFTVEFQLIESIRKAEPGLSHRKCHSVAIDLLDQVGIPSAHHRIKSYPHELSGGMAQRVMIAMAIACRPALLVADEPTTALDVTVQAQILSLLDQIRRDSNMAIILVSHDIGVIKQYADRVQVMYSGEIVESGPARYVTDVPKHPYTMGLINSLPSRQGLAPKSRLPAIPGEVPPIDKEIRGCRFAERCASARALCTTKPPMNLIVPDVGVHSMCHF